MDYNRNCYDVLGIPHDADTEAIRKAYLKMSLKFHPDKNPSNAEDAKTEFIEIGRAYETLRNPEKRRIYDAEVRRGKQWKNIGRFNGRNTPDDVYNNYRDVFDSTVSGMSEEELTATIGTVAALAGVVGSLLGGRMGSRSGSGVNGGQRSTTGRLLSSAGSMAGGFIAAEIASSSVRALHQDSVNRIQYKEECQRAVEAGRPLPPKPKASLIGISISELFKQTTNDIFSKSSDHSSNNNNNYYYYDNSNRRDSNHDKGNASRNNNANENATWQDNVTQFGWNLAAKSLKALQRDIDGKLHKPQ